MNEKELINQLIKQDPQAEKEFYQRYKKKLLRYINSKVPCQQDAEEILQDVFTAALKSLPNFSYDSSLYTYLCAIARHEIADFYRKKKIKTIVFSRFPFLKKLVSKALSPELSYEEKQMKKKIKQSFSSLKKEYSQVLKLKYVQGKQVKEIAAIIGKSFKATESMLFRARKAFQKEYSTLH
jgi:RNA polymerase sigma-70 factor (ECF subfamily)